MVTRRVTFHEPELRLSSIRHARSLPRLPRMAGPVTAASGSANLRPTSTRRSLLSLFISRMSSAKRLKASVTSLRRGFLVLTMVVTTRSQSTMSDAKASLSSR